MYIIFNFTGFTEKEKIISTKKKKEEKGKKKKKKQTRRNAHRETSGAQLMRT